MKISVKNNAGCIEREYLSISETYEYTGVAVRTIRKWLKDPLTPLPHFRMSDRLIKIRRKHIDEWFEQYKVDVNKMSDLDNLIDDFLA